MVAEKFKNKYTNFGFGPSAQLGQKSKSTASIANNLD
jgi:hypothetical protein